MKNSKQWIEKRIRTGWIILIAGILVSASGLLSELKISGQPFDFRIVTGLGILLIGIGIGILVRYGSAARDESAAKRITNEEHDERTLFIRAKAGNRAYWVSTAMVYAGLMWVSFASNGKLPKINEDALWYFLALAIILPFGIYLYNVIHEEKSS